MTTWQNPPAHVVEPVPIDVIELLEEVEQFMPYDLDSPRGLHSGDVCACCGHAFRNRDIGHLLDGQTVELGTDGTLRYFARRVYCIDCWEWLEPEIEQVVGDPATLDVQPPEATA